MEKQILLPLTKYVDANGLLSAQIAISNIHPHRRNTIERKLERVLKKSWKLANNVYNRRIEFFLAEACKNVAASLGLSMAYFSNQSEDSWIYVISDYKLPTGHLRQDVEGKVMDLAYQPALMFFTYCDLGNRMSYRSARIDDVHIDYFQGYTDELTVRNYRYETAANINTWTNEKYDVMVKHSLSLLTMSETIQRLFALPPISALSQQIYRKLGLCELSAFRKSSLFMI